MKKQHCGEDASHPPCHASVLQFLFILRIFMPLIFAQMVVYYVHFSAFGFRILAISPCRLIKNSQGWGLGLGGRVLA